MSVTKRISVCLASFNGEKYIEKQIASILSQLGQDDELIVSDDNSTDRTREIVESIGDHRIRLYINTASKGPVGNFNNALSLAKGEFIFLADQDDIWMSNKVNVILEKFEQNPQTTCVFSNAKLIGKWDEDLSELVFKNKPKLTIKSILIKNQFLGCTMAFKRLKNDIFPLPSHIPMHDWYIGLKHIAKGKVSFIDQPLIMYRRHGENVTTGKSSSLMQILIWRWQMLKALKCDGGR